MSGAAVVAEVYQAVRRGDIDAAVGLYSPDCEIHAPEGVLRGHAGVRAFWERRRAGYASVEVGEPEDLGDRRVLVQVRIVSDSPQGPVEVRPATLWTVRDGRVARWQWFPSRWMAQESIGAGNASEAGAG
ncbi:MAG TPA: nuclear transport factor 2 family protein [Solirubrobacterales bacterium]|nr:nuclear transport factor 2 family protein [Solirubrobacterales bacterium]